MFWGSHEWPFNLHKLLHCSEPLCLRRSNSPHQVHNGEKGNHVIGSEDVFCSTFACRIFHCKDLQETSRESISIVHVCRYRSGREKNQTTGLNLLDPWAKSICLIWQTCFFIKRFCQIHSASSRLSPFSLAHSLFGARFIPASIQAKSRLLKAVHTLHLPHQQRFVGEICLLLMIAVGHRYLFSRGLNRAWHWRPAWSR